MSVRNPEFRAQAQPVTLAAIQALFPTGSALVEFAVFTPYYSLQFGLSGACS
ncbi:MAG TPA: hypothetical protein VFY40_17530 [Blastocatellia bacterium]|nr:hypothetical protein [Blastocatellia bacterium]